MGKIVIRENVEQHIADLKAWLKETEENRLEEMADFFRERLSDYEEHMMVWKEAYQYLAEIFPGTHCKNESVKVLDLGCGTGLELDEILKRFPDIQVTGIDLSQDMLDRLRDKYPQIIAICDDYFKVDMGSNIYDVVITFESLHHFKPEKKLTLFEKVFRALKKGGIFLEVDYLACCEEEEQLLMESCDRKRKKEGIPEDMFVHFDTPLTVEKEIGLIQNAGFGETELIASIAGASFIRAVKGEKK